MYSCLVVGLGNIGMEYDLNSNHIQSHCKAINIHKGFYLAGAVEKNKLKRVIFEKKFKKPAFKSCKSALKNMSRNYNNKFPTKTHLPILKEIYLFINKSYCV